MGVNNHTDFLHDADGGAMVRVIVIGEPHVQPSTTTRFVDTLRGAAQRSARRADEAIAQGHMGVAYDLIANAYAALDRVFELDGGVSTQIICNDETAIFSSVMFDDVVLAEA